MLRNLKVVANTDTVLLMFDENYVEYHFKHSLLFVTLRNVTTSTPVDKIWWLFLDIDTPSPVIISSTYSGGNYDRQYKIIITTHNPVTRMELQFPDSNSARQTFVSLKEMFALDESRARNEVDRFPGEKTFVLVVDNDTGQDLAAAGYIMKLDFQYTKVGGDDEENQRQVTNNPYSLTIRHVSVNNNNNNNNNNDEFQPDFEDIPDQQQEKKKAQDIETCVTFALSMQNDVNTILFRNQRQREITFWNQARAALTHRNRFVTNSPIPYPNIVRQKQKNRSMWNLFAVYSVCCKLNCLHPPVSSCFEHMFEIVAAPGPEWAIPLSVTSHFDRTSHISPKDFVDDVYVRNPWDVRIPIITDLLAHVVNLNTGAVSNSYCIGRCLDPPPSAPNNDELNEQCQFSELVLPVLSFDDARVTPPSDKIPIPTGPKYEQLAQLFTESFTRELIPTECAICGDPIHGMRFMLADQLRRYQEEYVVDSKLLDVIPGSHVSIQEILQVEPTDPELNITTDDPFGGIRDHEHLKSTPVRLFTCTHMFHIGCISKWYCETRLAPQTPTCPVCRAKMGVPSPTVAYYPTAL